VRARRAPGTPRPRGPLARGVIAVGAWTRPRTWRLIGLMLLLLFYGAGWIIYAAGATWMLGLLVTGPAILVLVAAGNLMQDWLGIRHRPPQFADRTGTEDAGEVESSP
jgi:hypothetical protein